MLSGDDVDNNEMHSCETGNHRLFLLFHSSVVMVKTFSLVFHFRTTTNMENRCLL